MATTATPLTSTPYKDSPFYRLSALPDYLNPFDEPKVPRNLQRSDEFQDTNPLPDSSPSDRPNPFLDPSSLSAPEFGGRSSSSEDCNSFEMSGIAQDEEVESIPCYVLHPSRHVFPPAWHSGMNAPVTRLSPPSFHHYKCSFPHGTVACIPPLQADPPFLPSITTSVPSRMAQWHVSPLQGYPPLPSITTSVPPAWHSGMYPRYKAIPPPSFHHYKCSFPHGTVACIPVTRLSPPSFHHYKCSFRMAQWHVSQLQGYPPFLPSITTSVPSRMAQWHVSQLQGYPPFLPSITTSVPSRMAQWHVSPLQGYPPLPSITTSVPSAWHSGMYPSYKAIPPSFLPSLQVFLPAWHSGMYPRYKAIPPSFLPSLQVFLPHGTVACIPVTRLSPPSFLPSLQVFLPAWHSGMYPRYKAIPPSFLPSLQVFLPHGTVACIPVTRLSPPSFHHYKCSFPHGTVACIPVTRLSPSFLPSPQVFLPAWHSGMYPSYKAIPFLPSITTSVPSRMAQWHVSQLQGYPLPSFRHGMCSFRMAQWHVSPLQGYPPLPSFHHYKCSFPHGTVACIPVTRLSPSFLPSRHVFLPHGTVACTPVTRLSASFLPSRHVFLLAWHSGMYPSHKAIPLLPSQQ